MDAEELIAALGLQKHPEGGWYRETWRADAAPGQRAAGSAIYYLLRATELNAWHRVDDFFDRNLRSASVPTNSQ